ncbi:hypothetical protein ONZ45_g3199 [Pleurotus djamor]|nr:hypothetical protein ONZ45_g3199 [Pleurotus djamor]
MSATGNSGIMGLCFGPAASISPSIGGTLMDNLFASLPESDRYFAFKLGRDVTTSTNSSNDTQPQPGSSSSLTFGQIDTDYIQSLDDVTFHAVSKAGTSDYDFWKLSLRSITINSIPFELSPSLVPGADSPIAVLDTGTTLILGPTVDVDAIYQVLGQGARKDPFTGAYYILRNISLNVSFRLGDKDSEKEYPIHPRDMSWAEGSQQPDEWCLGGIQANDGVSKPMLISPFG